MDSSGISISNVVLDGASVSISHPSSYTGGTTTNTFSNMRVLCNSYTQTGTISGSGLSQYASQTSYIMQDCFFGKNCWASLAFGNNATIKNNTFLGSIYGDRVASITSFVGSVEVSGNTFTDSAVTALYVGGANTVVRDNTFTNMAFTTCMYVVFASASVHLQLDNNLVCSRVLFLFLIFVQISNVISTLTARIPPCPIIYSSSSNSISANQNIIQNVYVRPLLLSLC